MTEEQVELLRHLIKQEIDAAQIDGMEHGAWGWADKQLEEGWKCFIIGSHIEVTSCISNTGHTRNNYTVRVVVLKGKRNKSIGIVV